MNSNTRDALKEFIVQVQILAQGVIRETGVEDCRKLLEAGNQLKHSLDSDETIP